MADVPWSQQMRTRTMRSIGVSYQLRFGSITWFVTFNFYDDGNRVRMQLAGMDIRKFLGRRQAARATNAARSAVRDSNCNETDVC